MSKATKQATSTKPATKATPTARAAKQATGKQATPDTDETDETDEGEAKPSQWARELARAHNGEGNACRRAYALALALSGFAKPGETVRVSFAKANEAANLRRGASGDPIASWRLAVQRMRATYGGAEQFAATMGFSVSVDTDGAGALLVQG